MVEVDTGTRGIGGRQGRGLDAVPDVRVGGSDHIGFAVPVEVTHDRPLDVHSRLAVLILEQVALGLALFADYRVREDVAAEGTVRLTGQQ